MFYAYSQELSFPGPGRQQLSSKNSKYEISSRIRVSGNTSATYQFGTSARSQRLDFTNARSHNLKVQVQKGTNPKARVQKRQSQSTSPSCTDCQSTFENNRRAFQKQPNIFQTTHTTLYIHESILENLYTACQKYQIALERTHPTSRDIQNTFEPSELREQCIAYKN